MTTMDSGLFSRLRNTYAPVLAIPGVPRLLGGVFIAGTDVGLVPVGLVLMVSTHFHSYARSGLILAAYGIGSATWPVVQAWLFRRYGARRCVLPLAALAASALIVVLATCMAPSPLPAIAAAGIAGAGRPSLAAALRDAWPGLVGFDKELLSAAVALDASVFELLYLTGAAAGAAVVALAPPMFALVAAIVAIVAGALLFVSAGPLPSSVDPAAPAGRGSRFWYVIGWAPFGLVFGAYEEVAPAFATGRHPGTSGMLLALTAVGSTLIAIGYGLRRGAGRAEWVIPAGLGAAAGLLALVSLQDTMPVAALLAILLGAVFAPFAVETTRALAGVTTPLLWSMTLLVLGNAAGNAIAGALVDQMGWRVASAVVATMGLVGAIAIAVARPRGATGRQSADPAPAADGAAEAPLPG